MSHEEIVWKHHWKGREWLKEINESYNRSSRSYQIDCEQTSSWMNPNRNIFNCSYSIMSRRKQSNPKPLLKSEWNCSQVIKNILYGYGKQLKPALL